MFYATQNSDGFKIEVNAHIVKFATLAEAREFLLAPYGSEWDHSTAEISAGEFGDCWQKHYAGAPRVGDHSLSPFSLTQINVQRPGQHPGGKCFWLTPAPDVLVVTKILEKESD